MQPPSYLCQQEDTRVVLSANISLEIKIVKITKNLKDCLLQIENKEKRT